VTWPRNERGATAGLKTTSYAENVVALRAAHDAGAD
jgi:branched-chain amino acid aminotransferase